METRYMVLCLLIGATLVADVAATEAYFEQTQVFFEGQDGVTGLNFPYEVAVSPDGRHVYVAGSSSGLAIFARDGATGRLTYVSTLVDGAEGVDGISQAIGVLVSPDGGFVYVSANGEAAVSVFSRDAQTGLLTQVQVVRDGVDGVNGLFGAWDMAMSPNGDHLYVIGFAEGAVSVFSRNSGTGELTQVEVIRDGQDGVSGLGEPYGIDVAPDGTSVYVSGGEKDRSVATFSRNTSTGALTFLAVEEDGVDGVDGLAYTWDLTVSPDGNQVYVAGYLDNAIAIFDRDSITGLLTFQGLVEDGVGGADGLFLVTSIVVAPSGREVYAVGSGDNSVSVFARDPESGDLTYVESIRNNVDGATGLRAPAYAALSPNGAQIYAAAQFGSALAVIDTGVLISVSGVVSDASSGNPVSCAVVEVANVERSVVQTAVADVNGYYFVNLVPADLYDIRVVAPGFLEPAVAMVSLEEGPSITRDIAVAPDPAAADIVGHVSDADSEAPLVGVLVTARLNDEIAATTYTCAGGDYAFPPFNVKGFPSIMLNFDLPNYVDVDITVNGAKGVTTADVTMEKSIPFPATLTGVVLGATNNAPVPLNGAQVTIRGPVNQSDDTSGNGLYLFDAVLNGSYTVHASATGYVERSVGLSISGGSVAERSFTLVLDESGPGIAGDINGDGVVNAVDVQLVINGALGLTGAFPTDVNASGGTDAIDIQIVINAALGIS